MLNCDWAGSVCVCLGAFFILEMSIEYIVVNFVGYCTLEVESLAIPCGYGAGSVLSPSCRPPCLEIMYIYSFVCSRRR